MPRPNIPDPVDAAMQAPSYENQMRLAAAFLRRKAQGFEGIPSFAVVVSPGYALVIADWLDRSADHMEQHGG
jgi:hypothetical protein